MRKQAFSILSKKVNLKVLSISQRISLLNQGLNDRSAKVQSSCIDMIVNGWIPALNNDIISLLQKLDVEEKENQPILEKMFDSIFPLLLANDSIYRAIPKIAVQFHQIVEKAKNGDFKLLFSPEDLFYWRVILLFFSNPNKHSTFAHLSVDDLLPEISGVVFLLKLLNENGRAVNESYEYIIKQLLLMCKLLDFSDEAGRRTLENYLSKNSHAMEANN